MWALAIIMVISSFALGSGLPAVTNLAPTRATVVAQQYESYRTQIVSYTKSHPGYQGSPSDSQLQQQGYLPPGWQGLSQGHGDDIKNGKAIIWAKVWPGSVKQSQHDCYVSGTKCLDSSGNVLLKNVPSSVPQNAIASLFNFTGGSGTNWF